MNRPTDESKDPDILRMCKALDLCGAMFGLWFVAVVASGLLLRNPWYVIPWFAVSVLGILAISFIGNTLSAELARHSGSIGEQS